MTRDEAVALATTEAALRRIDYVVLANDDASDHFITGRARWERVGTEAHPRLHLCETVAAPSLPAEVPT